ncbi:MAG: hypothetical protein ACO1RT_02965 [Planctomycetaceae bacterium]
MNVIDNVRIRFSIGLLFLAVVHALLLALVFTALHGQNIRKPAENNWELPATSSGTPSASMLEKLDQPAQVNLQAQGELKQQSRAICPPCPPNSTVIYPTIVNPRIVQPSYVSPPIVVPSPSPVIVPPVRVSPTAPAPQPAKKNYQIALFLGSDAKSSQLLQWFDRDPQLAKLRSSCEFQVYTANNTLYRTRYASLVPTDQFPVVLFQDSSGGHIHAAGRTMIPTTATELYSDLRQGYGLYKQAQQAQKTGALKTRGYSWDEAISPAMYLSLDDCPDGYCPVEPSDTWRPGDRVRDLLFDEARDTRDALIWASAGELATIAMIVVAVILLGFILIKRGL